MPNRLAAETSPYLLQHAANPIDWYPWGEEALARARREDKLIFLSIGYAACHWCHVMAHESFEDASVAELLNRDFVAIKVDREERPDLDEIYMSATMLFSGGHGGWPMSVFLAPDLQPVFAGTYFPRDDAHGRPGFTTVVDHLQQAWRTRREDLLGNAGRVTEALRRVRERKPSGRLPAHDHIAAAASSVYRAFDQGHGGIPSGTNKFPQSLCLELLLRAWRSTGEERYRGIVELTLERICQGGIYDHLGGGLHRYATDARWLVPHFEKMLYDQALVVPVLLEAWQATRDASRKSLFADRVRGICDYVLRDLRSQDGAFYSSEDADSEGQEGVFYIWTLAEIREVLGEADARVFASHYDVTDYGNWMHPGDAHVPHGPKNVLQVVRSAEVLARLDGSTTEEVLAVLARCRRRLLEVRNRRPRPALDDKVLTGWNGLMIGALARAATVLDEPAYGQAAARAAAFVLETVRDGDRLLATYGRGQARLKAYSTDYAFMIEGLVDLYEWNGDRRVLREAERLADTMFRFYWDDEGQGFFFTASDHEELLLRSNSVQDGATPSANSVMALALQKLSILLGRPDFGKRAEAILKTFVDPSLRTVLQQERLLSALHSWQGEWDEVAIIGDPDHPGTRALVRKVHSQFRPTKVVAQSRDPVGHADPRSPLLAGRGLVDGQPTAHLCHGYECRQPVTDPAQLFSQ